MAAVLVPSASLLINTACRAATDVAPFGAVLGSSPSGPGFRAPSLASSCSTTARSRTVAHASRQRELVASRTRSRRKRRGSRGSSDDDDEGLWDENGSFGGYFGGSGSFGGSGGGGGGDGWASSGGFHDHGLAWHAGFLYQLVCVASLLHALHFAVLGATRKPEQAIEGAA